MAYTRAKVPKRRKPRVKTVLGMAKRRKPAKAKAKR